MIIYFRLLRESIRFATNALVNNMLRTFLSLLGVTIGIFAIISVLSAVDSLEKNVREDVDSIGSDILYVQKWPWGGGGEYPWWKYMKRPEPTYKEYKSIKKQLQNRADVSMGVGLSRKTAKYGNNSIEEVDVFPVTHEYSDLESLKIVDGRYFSEIESRSGQTVCIIGHDIVKGLFENTDPVGKYIKILGRKVMVIGTLEKEGSSIIGPSKDDRILIPVNFIRKLYNLNEGRISTFVMVKPVEGITFTQIKDDVKMAMRGLRRLRPGEEDDFALNEISVISNSLDGFFAMLNIAGFLIGGFSILVGGFGIANIMFVSVKERTHIIGIQKSLGAKGSFILFQFLFESIILSGMGGLVGILIVFALTFFGEQATGMSFYLSTKNIVIGMGISTVIGLISGVLPAFQAARMDPVEAIRSNA